MELEPFRGQSRCHSGVGGGDDGDGGDGVGGGAAASAFAAIVPSCHRLYKKSAVHAEVLERCLGFGEGSGWSSYIPHTASYSTWNKH